MPHKHPKRRDFNEFLAVQLGERRRALGLSQTSLAEELGLDQTIVSRVELGGRKLSVQEVMRWLEALGLTPHESGELLAVVWSEHGARPSGYWENGND